MKKRIGTIVGKLSGREEAARKKTPSKKTQPRFPLDFPSDSSTDVTGQTIFGDRALRFRTLTLSQVDLQLLENASRVVIIPGLLAAGDSGRRGRHLGADRHEVLHLGRPHQLPVS